MQSGFHHRPNCVLARAVSTSFRYGSLLLDERTCLRRLWRVMQVLTYGLTVHRDSTTTSTWGLWIIIEPIFHRSRRQCLSISASSSTSCAGETLWDEVRRLAGLWGFLGYSTRVWYSSSELGEPVRFWGSPSRNWGTGVPSLWGKSPSWGLGLIFQRFRFGRKWGPKIPKTPG